MYAIMRKSISSGKTSHVLNLGAIFKPGAITEFTDTVRSWLREDVSGKVIYSADPKPGYYDESENEILLDGETIERWNDGHFDYYIEEV